MANLQSSKGKAPQLGDLISGFRSDFPLTNVVPVSLSHSDYENGVIRASEFRTYHTPLNKQSDFVNAMRAAREFSSRISDSLKIDIFPLPRMFSIDFFCAVFTVSLIITCRPKPSSLYLVYFCHIANGHRACSFLFLVEINVGNSLACALKCSLWSSAIILPVLAMVVVDLMVVLSICGPPSTSLLVENRNAPNEKQEHQVLNSQHIPVD
ncbi:hypothetical protein Sjap_017531 [Stephania japonica]|uniref:Uncharacterized protein n=1 Tax=Stephania japonica TaxID=461633 RepID=A0AAP0I6I0_9MAGN